MAMNAALPDRGDSRTPSQGAVAVVMAGGAGTRLRPLTEVLPKVLMPLDGGTVLDRIVNQLWGAGITDVRLLLGHQSDLVRAYAETRFDGADGIRLTAHEGTEGQGTAGPLRVLPADEADWLVINGDIIADFDPAHLLKEHEVNKADLTVVGAQYHAHVPYGVLDVDGDGTVRRVDEKPVVSWLVSAGIYVIGARARQLLPAAGECDMTEVITLCDAMRLRVLPYRLTGPWYDIGTCASYEALLRTRRDDALEPVHGGVGA